MDDSGDQLPNPDISSDEEELSEDEIVDSETEEDSLESWRVNPRQPADPEGFSIYFTNVQSLKYKLDLIYHETDEIQAVALCETWLDKRTQDEELQLPGFNTILRRDRPGEAYGGVGLYLRQEIHYERREDLESGNIE